MTDDTINLCNRFLFMVERLDYWTAVDFMKAVYGKKWIQKQELIFQWYDYEFNNLESLQKERQTNE